MKVGVWIPSVRRFASNQAIRASVLQAERLGYDSIWTIDHVIAPVANAEQFGLVYDPLIVMALAAGITERIEIGVSVLVLPYRHGVLTAKMLATLDDLSNGRIILGRGLRLERRRVRHPGAALRGARPDDRRVHQDHAELWTESEADLRGEVHASSRTWSSSRCQPSRAARRSGWAGAVGRRCAGPPSMATPGTRSTSRRTGSAGKAEIERLSQRFGRASRRR